VLVDLSTYTGISIAPSGGGLGASTSIPAIGVVVDNMQGAGDCSVTIGPITTLVPRFQKVNLPIPQSTNTVTFSGAAIKPIAYFYTGTFHGEGGNVNAFASQEAANVASITGGTTDAYLDSITWNVNVKLANGYNLDNLTISGFYDVLNPTNAGTALSAGTWQIDCRVYSSSALNIYQLARNLLSTDTQVWERRCVVGTWTPWRPIGQPVTGQCQFQYVDATHCRLMPLNGGLLLINGNLETVPYNAGNGLVIGNTIGVTTLSVSTLYYCYAYMSAPGVMALEWSTTAYGLDTRGCPIKAGDPTRTCVGMAYYLNQSTGQFADNLTYRLVATYFNRVRRPLYYYNGNAIGTGSTTPVAIGFLYCLSWGDASVHCRVFGYSTQNTAGNTNYTWAGINGNVGSSGAITLGTVGYAGTSFAEQIAVPPTGLVNMSAYIAVNAGGHISFVTTVGDSVQ
jgi:hypothetical protein